MIMITQPPMVKIVVPIPPVPGKAESFVLSFSAGVAVIILVAVLSVSFSSTETGVASRL